MTRSTIAFAAALIAAPGLAAADELAAPPPPTEPAVAVAEPEPPPSPPPMADAMYGETLAVESGSARSNAAGWVVMPPGWEASGELRFLTADAPPGGTRTKLTDLVVARASLRHSFGGRIELGGGIDLLPKQPSDGDASVFEGADLDLRYAVGKKAAVYTAVSAGPLIARDGVWTTAGLGVLRRSIVHDTLSFQLALGGDVTTLGADSGDRANIGELTTSARTLFQIQDAFGLWFSGGFAFPVAHGGTLPGGVAVEPHTRVDLSVGMVYSLVDDWDVYMDLSVIDRGELAAPGTTLPILEGGSDQRVFTFGVTRHFGEHDHGDGGGYAMMALE